MRGERLCMDAVLCVRHGAAARDADLARGELAQMTIQAGMALRLLAKAQADVTQLAVHVQGVVAKSTKD